MDFVPDFKTIEIISDILAPDSLSTYDSVVIEYVARRFFSTLVQCWSGPRVNTFNFKRNAEFSEDYEFEFCAHFDINFQLNGQGCECKLLIGPKIKNILHELWHKQNNIEQDKTDSVLADDDFDISEDGVEAAFEVPEEPISIVISELAIPESDLTDYLESGTLINLEQNVDDRVSLKLNTDNSWMTGKLVTISDIDKFGIKIIESDVSEAEIAKGSVKASFVLGEIEKSEISKVDFKTFDIIFNTGVNVNNKVDIIVNNEQVAKGKLMIHDGNLAIEVL